MNLHAIPNFLAAILIFITGLFATLRNRKSKINFLFFLLTFSAFIWQLGTGLALLSKYPSFALIATRIAFFGIALIPLFSYHLSLYISGININRTLVFGYLCALLFFIPLSWTPLIFNGVYTYPWGFFFKAGQLHPIFMVFFIYFMVLVFSNLFLSYKRETKPFEKIRKRYFLIALFIAYIGCIDYLPTYGIRAYPFGYLTLISFVLVFAYAILRFQLMDITIAVTRTGIFALVYTLVLGVPFWIGYHTKSWFMPTAFMAILATLGPSIYSRLRRQAENRLLAEEYQRHETLHKSSQDMLRFTKLDTLLKAIVHNLVKVMQIKFAGVYLSDNKGEFRLHTFWQPDGHQDKPNLPTAIDKNSSVIERLSEDLTKSLYSEEIKFYDQPKNYSSFERFKEELKYLGGTCLIIPASRQNQLLGFLILGEKRSQRLYTTEDQTVLMVLANHAALAIENCQFYALERERQAIMFHASSLASLGTMASMMGHQVNNRFQAITALAGRQTMLKYILEKNPNLSSEQILKLLNEDISIFEKLEQEGKKGGEVVASIRRLSQLSKEEFKPITIQEALKIALDVLQYKIKLNLLDFIMEIPEDLPKVQGDPAQLGEVFFNLIDNAHDAIKEKAQNLNDPNYKGKIEVRAFLKDKTHIQVDISDNAIGIKEEFLPKLFVPFFTTKASSQKGTGLGLHVVREIIRFHKGDITAKSIFDQGTTFCIVLPIAVLSQNE